MSSAAEKLKAQRLSQLSKNSAFLVGNGQTPSKIMTDEDEENLVRKVKKKSDKKSYDEDIIDGFEFLSFETYQDIEETFKPFLKTRIENHNHALDAKKKIPKPRLQNRVPKLGKRKPEAGPGSPRLQNFDCSSDVSLPGSSFGELMIDASESEDTSDTIIEPGATQGTDHQNSQRNSFGEEIPSSLPPVLSPIAPVPNQEKQPSPIPGTTVMSEQFPEVVGQHQESSQTPSSSIPPAPDLPESPLQKHATPRQVAQPPVEPPIAHAGHVDQKYPSYSQGYFPPQAQVHGQLQHPVSYQPPSGTSAYQPAMQNHQAKSGIRAPYPPFTGQNYYSDPSVGRPVYPQQQQLPTPLSLTVRQDSDMNNYTVQNLVKRERSESGKKTEELRHKIPDFTPKFPESGLKAPDFGTKYPEFGQKYPDAVVQQRMAEKRPSEQNFRPEPFRPFESSSHERRSESGSNYSVHPRFPEPPKSEVQSELQKYGDFSHNLSHYKPYEQQRTESQKPRPEYLPDLKRDMSERPLAYDQRFDPSRQNHSHRGHLNHQPGSGYSAEAMRPPENVTRPENAQREPDNSGRGTYSSEHRVSDHRLKQEPVYEPQGQGVYKSGANFMRAEPENLSVGANKGFVPVMDNSRPSAPSEPPWPGMPDPEASQKFSNTHSQVPHLAKQSNQNQAPAASPVSSHPFSMNKLVGNYPSISQPEDLSRLPNGYPAVSQSYPYHLAYPQYSTQSAQVQPLSKPTDISPAVNHGFFRPITSPYPTPPVSGLSSGSEGGHSAASLARTEHVAERGEPLVKPPSPSPRSRNHTNHTIANLRSSSVSSPHSAGLPRPGGSEAPSFRSVSKTPVSQPMSSSLFSPNYQPIPSSMPGGMPPSRRDYPELRHPSSATSLQSPSTNSMLYSSGPSHFSKVDPSDSLSRIAPGSNFGRLDPIPVYQPHQASPFYPPGGELSSFNSVAQAGQVAAPSSVKKSGRWNSMHVRVAWEIYQHQQRARTTGDPKRASFQLSNSVPNVGSAFPGKHPAGPPSSLFPGLSTKPILEPAPVQSTFMPPPSTAAPFAVPSSIASPYQPFGLQPITQPQVTKATPTQSPSIDTWTRQHRTPPVSVGTSHSGPTTPNWLPRSDSANSMNREKDRERQRREEHRKPHSINPTGHSMTPSGHSINSSHERRRSHSRSPHHVDALRTEAGPSRSDIYDLKGGRTSMDRMKPSEPLSTSSTSRAPSGVNVGYDPRTSLPNLPTLPSLSSVPSLQMNAPSLYSRDLGMSGLDRNMLQSLSGAYAGMPTDPRLSALGFDPMQQAYLADREREAIMKMNANRYGLGLPAGLGYGMERYLPPGLDLREFERAKLAAAFGLSSSSLLGPQLGNPYQGLSLPPVSAPSIPVSAYQPFSHYPKTQPSATSFGYGPTGSVGSMMPSVSRASGLGLGLGSAMGLSSSALNGLYPSGANSFLSQSLRPPAMPQSLGIPGYPNLSSMGMRHPSLGYPGLDPLGPRPPF